jgi:cytochrome c oxidase subunit II
MNPPSAFDAAGPQSAAIGVLTWYLLALAAVVYVLVMAAMVAGVRRAPAAAADGQDARLRKVVIAAVAVTSAAVVAVLVLSVATGRTLAALPDDDRISVRVTGHQWWWELEYEESDPSLGFPTANEMHVPVGATVTLTLASNDVIHSLWVPNLHGKRDLIPGRLTTLSWRADRPGTYRGMCAEFCGHQHAHMGLLVVAEPRAEFEAWRARQRRSASEPSPGPATEGRRLFQAVGCGLCHSVRGTDAGGRAGPDLTHLASRQTLAAVTLPNTREHLGDWITDPQRSKPGNHMPASPMRDQDRASLVAYLQELK